MTTNPTPPRDDVPELHRYTKKPVTIEAFQMTKERRMDNSDWPQWLHEAWQDGTLHRQDMDAELPDLLITKTFEGQHIVSWGDWIIRGVKGELYPCKPDIFEATYSLAALLPTEAGAEPVAWRYEKNGKTFINEHQQPWKANDGWVITPLYATPPAAPTDNTALVDHIKKMQSYVQEYLEPGPYVAKHGKGGTFDEPHPHQDEAHAYFMRQQMREALLNDLIHMLDGPEERAALSREAPQAVTVQEAAKALLDAIEAYFDGEGGDENLGNLDTDALCALAGEKR